MQSGLCVCVCVCVCVCAIGTNCFTFTSHADLGIKIRENLGFGKQ